MRSFAAAISSTATACIIRRSLLGYGLCFKVAKPDGVRGLPDDDGPDGPDGAGAPFDNETGAIGTAASTSRTTWAARSRSRWETAAGRPATTAVSTWCIIPRISFKAEY